MTRVGAPSRALSLVRAQRVTSDAVASDGATIEELYAAHRDLVFRIASRLGGGDRAFAEDLTQDVFLYAMRRHGPVLALENPAGWFYRVTTHRGLNRLRRERFLGLPAVRWMLGMRAPPPVDPERLGISHDLLRHALRRVLAMPPKMRACFFMLHVDGKSQTEIAEILGHTKGYVSKLVARCERELQPLLDDEGHDDA